MAKEIKIDTLDQDSNIIPISTWNYQDSFLYWKSIEAIDYNVGIKNKPKAKIGYFTITTTWSKSITWVGFKPSLVQFFYTDQAGWSGAGSMTELWQFAHDYMWSGSSDQTHCIYLRDAWWTTVCYCTYTSMDADWFTINVATWTWTSRIDYIAYL